MFITFEGPEGCGKTTQIPLLAAYLRSAGHQVLETREPGGTTIGDQIRRVLLDRTNTAMLPRTEVLLFQAARAQHIDEIILPALAAGKVVLCDRYADSTLAYQGYGYGADLKQLRTIVAYATQGLQPDLTVLLDVNVAEGLQRRSDDGDWNRLDAYQVDFYKRVRSGYHEMAAEEPGRWLVVDGSQAVEAVQAAIQAQVLARLRARTG